MKFTHTLTILLFSVLNMFGQNYAVLTTEDACSTTNKLGQINIELDESLYESTWRYPFEISWVNLRTGENGQSEITSSSFNIGNLSHGDIEIIIDITDECSLMIEEIILDASPLISTTVVSPCGDLDGEIQLEVTNWNSPLTIVLNKVGKNGLENLGVRFNSNGLENFTNLNSGDYVIAVRDGYCGTSLHNISIAQNDIVIEAESISNTCVGDGSININVNGGQPPYSYAWSNGEETEDISSLSVGSYTVTVTDELGCTAQNVFNVERENDFHIERDLAFQAHNKDACGTTLGRIRIIPVGGAIDNWNHFTAQWSGGNETGKGQMISGPPGLYSVTLTDEWGCTDEETFEIKQGQVSIEEVDRISPSDCSDPRGSIFIDTQPKGNYTYLWSGGSTQKDLINVSPGVYSVTLTNTDEWGNECVSMMTFEELKEPCCDNNLAISIVSTTSIRKFNDPDYVPNGSLDVTVTGGSGNYSVRCIEVGENEIPKSSDFIFNGLEGIYRIEVEDLETGCTKERLETVLRYQCGNINSVLVAENIDNKRLKKWCDPPKDSRNLQNVSCTLEEDKKLIFRVEPLASVTLDFPYTITLSRPNFPDESISINSLSELLSYQGTDDLSFCMPVSTDTYTYSISNGCDEVITEEFYTCEPCGTWKLFEDESPTKHKYRLIPEGMEDDSKFFGIDIWKPCSEKKWGQIWKKKTELELAGETMPQPGTEYMVSWPDGDEVWASSKVKWRKRKGSFGLDKTKKWSRISKGDQDWEPSEDDFDDIGPFNVRIERLDRSDCNTKSIDVYLGQSLKKMILTNNVWGGYSCATKCTGGCTHLYNAEKPEVVVDDICEGNKSKSRPFEYTPKDYDNPCYGGGTIKGFIVNQSGKMEVAEIDVGPGEYAIGPAEYQEPFCDVQFSWGECLKGGGCLFDGDAMFANGGPAIMAYWCQSNIKQNFFFDSTLYCPTVEFSQEPSIGGLNLKADIRNPLGYDYNVNCRIYLIVRYDNSSEFRELLKDFTLPNRTITHFTHNYQTGSNVSAVTIQVEFEGEFDPPEQTCPREYMEVFEFDEFIVKDPPSDDVVCSDQVNNIIYDTDAEAFFLLHENDQTGSYAVSRLDPENFDQLSQKIYQEYQIAEEVTEISTSIDKALILHNDSIDSYITRIDKEEGFTEEVMLGAFKIHSVQSVNDSMDFWIGDHNGKSHSGFIINGIPVPSIEPNINLIKVGSTDKGLVKFGQNTQSNMYELIDQKSNTVISEWAVNISPQDIKELRILDDQRVLIANSSNTIFVLDKGSSPKKYKFAYSNVNLVGIDEAKGNDVLAYGDFSGQLNIDGEMHQSQGGTDIFFAIFNSDLELIHFETEGAQNNENILGAKTAEDEYIAYFGTYDISTELEGITFNTDSSCFFIVGDTIPSCDSCAISCEDCTDCALCPYCDECTDCESCTDCSLCPDCEQCQDCDECTDCSLCPQCPVCQEECNSCTDCALCPDCPDCQTDCAECDDCTQCPDCPDCVSQCQDCTDCLDCPWCPDCVTTCTDCLDCNDCSWCEDCLPDPSSCPELIDFQVDISEAEVRGSVLVPVRSQIKITLFAQNGLDWEPVSFLTIGPKGPGIIPFIFNIDGYMNQNLKLVISCLSCNNDCVPIEVPFDTYTRNRERQVTDQFDFDMSIYPNPTKSEFTADIHVQHALYGKISVRDIHGKLIFEDEIPLGKGGNRYHFASSKSWEAGVYVVSFDGQGVQERIKIIKL